MKHVLLLILLAVCSLLRGQAPALASPPAQTAPNETVLVLKPNQPNPFSEETTIRFQLNKPEAVTITLYNVLGSRISVLLKENLEAGDHNYLFRKPAGLPDGMYIYTVETPGLSRSQRMIIRK
jgi:hypothetical protein